MMAYGFFRSHRFPKTRRTPFLRYIRMFRSAPKSWENPSNSGVRAFWPAPEMRKLVEPVRVCQKLAHTNMGGNFSREGEPKMAFRHQRGRRGRDGGREGEGEGQAALAAVAGPSQNGHGCPGAGPKARPGRASVGPRMVPGNRQHGYA